MVQDKDAPTLHGDSKAIHVPDQGFTVVPLPTGPVKADPTYSGQSDAITAHQYSPPQWQDPTITGPMVDYSVYRGRSQAIHVYGTDVAVLPNPGPIPSCRCCAEVNDGTGHARGDCGHMIPGCQVLDNFGNRSTAPSTTGWADSSYIFANGVRLKWIASDNSRAWVDLNRGLLRTSVGVSTTVTVESRAPTEYSFTGSFIEASGYWYTVAFALYPVPTNASFRLRDANGEVVLDLATRQLTIRRFGTGSGGAVYVSDVLPIEQDIDYVLEMHINPTTTRAMLRLGPTDASGALQPPTVLFDMTTNPVTTTPLNSQGVDIQLAMIGAAPVADSFVIIYSVQLAPCERPIALAQLWSGYRGHQTTKAFAMGGPVTVVEPPGYVSTGLLDASWDGADGTFEFNDQGDHEREVRSWNTWLVPPGTQTVRLIGTAKAIGGIWPGPFTGLTTDVNYQLGVVTLDPDVPPANWDNIGSGLNGTVTMVDDPNAEPVQVFDKSVSTFGASYDPGYGTGWHLLQLAIKNVSPVGIGGHQIAFKGTPPDGNYEEVLPRFPNNPNWCRAEGAQTPCPYIDYSMSQSGVRIDVNAWAFGTVGASPGDGTDNGATINNNCAACDDPANPGTPIPPFTPGYMPIFRRQIGDPTTGLDSVICTLESGAMLLDWQTRGAVQVWGGDLIPYCGKTASELLAQGSNLGNVQQAWRHWSQYLDNRTGSTYAAMIACLQEGRALILQGDYGIFNLAERCQDSFTGGHAVTVYPYQKDGYILVGDPLCSGFHGIKSTSLQAYAEAFSGGSGIFFAVSRPWTP